MAVTTVAALVACVVHGSAAFVPHLCSDGLRDWRVLCHGKSQPRISHRQCSAYRSSPTVRSVPPTHSASPTRGEAPCEWGVARP